MSCFVSHVLTTNLFFCFLVAFIIYDRSFVYVKINVEIRKIIINMY